MKRRKQIVTAVVALSASVFFWQLILHFQSPPDINPRDSFRLTDAHLAELSKDATRGDWRSAGRVGEFWFMYKNQPGCAYKWFALSAQYGGPSGEHSYLEITKKMSNGVAERADCGPR